MRIVNKKIILASIMLVVVTTGVLICRLHSDKETQLDSVKLKEVVNNEMFAIMLEQDDGTYKESTDNSWPTEGYTYDSKKSGCVDVNGNKIENALVYNSETKIATVETGNTSYCYLYFSLPKTAPGTMLEGEKNIGYVIEGGMYRYQGISSVVNNNYICFGTSSQSDCLDNTDKYLYRIIGITQDNKMKLIKNTSLGSKKWHNNFYDNTWPNSDLFKSLNGLETDTITPIFIDSSTYEYMEAESNWYNKILTTNWKYGDLGIIDNYDGATIYAVENAFVDSTSTDAWTNEISAKVSLMYVHDYLYAYGVGGVPGNYNTAKTAWIHISNCASSTNEWTMSRYGAISDFAYGVAVVESTGRLRAFAFTNSYVFRPVFFLEPTIQITDGTGLSTDPFVIN